MLLLLLMPPLTLMPMLMRAMLHGQQKNTAPSY